MLTLTAGLSVGSIYALVALGYCVTYLAARAVNFAHGYLQVLGSFVAYSALTQFGLPVVAAFVVTIVTLALGNLLVEIAAIRFIREKSSHAELVTTVGAATIIMGFMTIIWGTDPLRVDLFSADTYRALSIGGVGPVDYLLIAATILIGSALEILSRKTRFGLAALAVAEDREAAMLRGINVKLLSTGAFILAGAIAGMVAPLVGAKTFAIAEVAPALAVKGFVVAAIGGIGRFRGALIFGLAIGVIEAYVARYTDPIWQNFVVYVVFIGLMMLRPAGVFGSHGLRHV